MQTKELPRGRPQQEVDSLVSSIQKLLEEVVDACSEEGMPCCGMLRRRLQEKLQRLAHHDRTASSRVAGDSERATIYWRMIDALDGPEVSASDIVRMQRELLRLWRPMQPR